MNERLKLLAQHKYAKVIISLLVIFSVWRIALFFLPNTDQINLSVTSIFWWGGLYQIIAIVGSIYGFIFAKHWGSLKSIMGRAIGAISFGLLLQAYGQSVATYYVYTNVQGLYPSIADIGFFGSVLMYIYGAILLAKASGIKVSLKSYANKIQAVVIPLVLLSASYYVFLRGYEFDWTNKLKIFLDFGYPLGQALYVSLAILTLILSRKILGGIMKVPMIFLLLAFVIQYFCDYSFLYQSNNGSYIAGGIVDSMYMISYFAMSLSLIQLGRSLDQIRDAQ